MLRTNERKLEELVVETLAESPHLSAEGIRLHVERRHRVFTVQAIYQELRKLERNGVVVRKRGLYSLRLLWLVEMSDFVSGAYVKFLKSDALLNEVPEEPGKKRWTFSNLRQLLDLWTELTFLLVPKVPVAERVLLEHVEHVWFHTANPVNEEQFARAMKRERVRYVLVSRGKTFLDTTYRESLSKFGGECAFGVTGFPGKPDTYLSVLGSYVIDVKLAPALAAAVRETYRKIKGPGDLEPQALLHFAASRGRCTLELSLNPDRARRERRKFESYFGKELTPPRTTSL